MKITSVDIIDVANDFASATSKWRPVVVKINTDEGISGFGEVGLAYGVGASAGIGMAKDLAGSLIGMDPMNNEAIWEKMLKKTFWGQGGGGIFSAAMSGIDIALWDIKGKAWGVPLYKMLGGKSREKIRTYASQLQFGWGDGSDKDMLTEPEQYAQAALTAVSEGYDAIKSGYRRNGSPRQLEPAKTSTGLSPIKSCVWATTVWPPFAMQSARTWISSPKCMPLRIPPRRFSLAA